MQALPCLWVVGRTSQRVQGLRRLSRSVPTSILIFSQHVFEFELHASRPVG